MFNPNHLTPDAKAYFDAMPHLMQETLIQSGMPYTTKQQLEIFADPQSKNQ